MGEISILNEKKPLACAIGMFDGVHLGHQALLRFLCEEANVKGIETAVFTFATHPLDIVAPAKSPLLLTPFEEKKQLLQIYGAKHVFALNFDERLRQLSARQFMRMLKLVYGVEVIVLGFNHRFGHDRLSSFEQYRAEGAAAGVEVVKCQIAVEVGLRAGTMSQISSSAIRSALLYGDVSDANTMLGREYVIEGKIKHGQGVGHTIGFPTANLYPMFYRQLVPGPGVYAGRAIVEGDTVVYPAMTNIGRRPTLGTDLDTTIEANLIGFNGDLYDKRMKLYFGARIRSECRFSSLEELQAQLIKDQAEVLRLMK